MEKPKVPKFASEADEAQWWYDHRDELPKPSRTLRPMANCERARPPSWHGNAPPPLRRPQPSGSKRVDR